MFARGIAPVAGALLGVVLGCTLDLSHRIACGDGYVDEAAGEECDPEVPESFERACINEQKYGAGVGGCDKTTCQLLVNDVQCAFCGDGEKNHHPGQPADEDESVTDEGEPSTGDSSETGEDTEDCDGTDVVGTCPDMVTPLRCNDDCSIDRRHCPEFCGDGEPNGKEECDPELADISSTLQQCAPDKLGRGGVRSPYLSRHVYGSGTTACDDSCRWQQAGCSYCGNEKIDRGLFLDRELKIPQDVEICDGLSIDESTFDAAAIAACAAMSPTLQPNVRCADDCSRLDDGPDDEPPCCTRTKAICPGPDEPQCCSAYLHAGDVIPFEPCTEASKFEPSFCR